MIKDVLLEIRRTNGTIDLGELNRKLNIERNVLTGMIQCLADLGYITTQNTSLDNEDCGCGKCNIDCSTPSSDFSKSSKSFRFEKQ